MLSIHRALRGSAGKSKAFTLTELLIVILIIAILMAFVLPRFFGARRSAGDRVAQQTLEVAARSAASLATDSESYTSASASGLGAIEPDITFVSGALSEPSGNSRAVSVTATDDVWTAAAIGADGRCWLVRMNFSTPPEPTEYGFAEATAANCNSATVPTGTDWQEREFPSGN